MSSDRDDEDYMHRATTEVLTLPKDMNRFVDMNFDMLDELAGYRVALAAELVGSGWPCLVDRPFVVVHQDAVEGSGDAKCWRPYEKARDELAHRIPAFVFANRYAKKLSDDYFKIQIIGQIDVTILAAQRLGGTNEIKALVGLAAGFGRLNAQFEHRVFLSQVRLGTKNRGATESGGQTRAEQTRAEREDTFERVQAAIDAGITKPYQHVAAEIGAKPDTVRKRYKIEERHRQEKCGKR
ncbi:MAG: hypothetical protein AAFS07_11975 [Pseudomonadota bacterium]